MGNRVDYLITITDSSGATVVADPVGAGNPATGDPGYAEIDLKPRHNEAGFGAFTASATPDLLSAANQPGNRVAVIRDGVVEMCGPIETPKHGYHADRDGSDGYGMVTVNFADDTASLADRLVYPNPALESTAQDVAKYVITAVNPEDAMRTLVNMQAGPGALPQRQVPGLALGVDHGLKAGVTVTTSFTRATVLTDALREIARLSGGAGLGFRIIQSGGQLLFDVYEPQDLTGSIFFSRALGNLSALEYEPSTATATVAIVGDATAGASRVIRERLNVPALAAGHRRKEVFVDARSASNVGELDQAGDEALADGAPRIRFALTAIETPNQRYAYDFARGDLVSAEPYGGGPLITALVLGADIRVTPDRGEVVTPIIGVEGDQIADAKAAELRRLWKRIAQLEGAL